VTAEELAELRRHEGELVDVLLVDGSRIEGSLLVSAGRRGMRTVWVVAGDDDLFVPAVDLAGVEVHTAPGPSVAA
jgi:hypothetical protein